MHEGRPGLNPMKNPSPERLVDLNCNLLGPTPRRGHRHPPLGSEHLHQAGASAVREAVPFRIVQHRQEHGSTSDRSQKPRYRIRGCRARAFLNDEDQRHPVGGLQRQIPSTHVDGVEPPGAKEALFDQLGNVITDPVTHGNAGQRRHLLSGDRLIAVHTDLDDGAGLKERDGRGGARCEQPRDQHAGGDGHAPASGH